MGTTGTVAADRLVVVTATTSATRFEQFDAAQARHAAASVPIVVVGQRIQRKQLIALERGVVLRADDYLGVVPAFAAGVEMALRAYPNAEVIACLHDDCLLDEPGWDERLLSHFDRFPRCGLAGFGGAWGLGDENAGKPGEAYRPTWLVRRGFMSNMPDAEVHGRRYQNVRQVAVLDGFSLCFRRDFLLSKGANTRVEYYPHTATLFSQLQSWGVVHHAYDAAMGAFAKECGWETWYLPFACRHLGGQTAVGDAGYAAWAKQQTADGGGDQRFWEEAHGIVWTKLGHLLPFEAGGRI